MNRNIFGEICEGEMDKSDFDEWLIQYTEDVCNTVNKTEEINLTSLKEWATSNEQVWDSFEVGYETARNRVKSLLGISDE
jgi:3-phenylpropionate/cinnamic acid dioxygenase small subunit